MAKNLDGIKKLNPEEINKNRKIVLSYIREKASALTKEQKITSQVASVFNKVDGLKLGKISGLKLKVNNILEKPALARNNQMSKQKKINFDKERAEVEETRKWHKKLRLEEQKKEEEKIKRRKARKLFRRNLNNKLSEFFYIIKRNFVHGVLYLITFLAISYIVFCLLVLRFQIDGGIIEKMARILPVPAVVTSQGIINYYDFRKIKNNNYINLNLAEKKDSLAKWAILKNLSGKYGLPVDSPGQALAVAFVADEDFNQVGLFRIKKISELLKNVESLDPLGKYADEYSDVTYYNSKGAAEKFGQAVFNLKAGQISDIILSDNGYYIAQIMDNKDSQLGIKYLFVGAKILDQYIGEKSEKSKVFILAN